MKIHLLLPLLFISLLITACDYPDNPKDVAVGMCQATKELDLSGMKKYTTKAYGHTLKRQMKALEKAIDANDPKALELKHDYSKIICTDLQLQETLGRIMTVTSGSPVINGMRLQQVNREWKVIQ